MILVYQFYWVLFMLINANSLDVLFCSWLLFACEQLQHLKQIMKPLMELSATLDTVVPNSSELFKVRRIFNDRRDERLARGTIPRPSFQKYTRFPIHDLFPFTIQINFDDTRVTHSHLSHRPAINWIFILHYSAHI